MSITDLDVGPAEPSVRRRLSWRRAVLAVLMLVLLGVLGKGYWVWTHPTLIRFNNGEVGGTDPSTKTAWTFGFAAPDTGQASETITFASASAHFKTNTANATATLSICVARPGAEEIGAWHAEDMSRFCSRVIPIRHGTKMNWTEGDQPPQYIFITIKPTTIGFARIDSATLNYARGSEHLWQHGSYEAPFQATLSVTP